MIINDHYICNFNIHKFSILEKKYPKEFHYLLNRFSDSDSIQESYYRIKNHIEVKPICPVCGKPIKFNGIFNKTCGDKYCIKYMVKDTYKQTCLEKYGTETYNNREKAKKTCLDKYGVEYPSKLNNVKEKQKQTCLKKYGVEYVSQLLESTEKSKLTRFKKYNEWNSNKNKEALKNKSKEVKIQQIKKTKKTKLEKYGDENYNNIEKYKITSLKKYGVNYPNQSKIVREKYKNTCLKKYGVDNYSKTEEFHLNIDWKEKDKKTKQTKLERYGDKNYQNIEKHKQTCFKNYGVEYPSQSDKIKEKINNTKNKNHTFNTSKPEEKSYELLKEKYPNVIRQYKSKEYPFICDFYIPSLNLYIECNYHWTHGGHPYNENNIDDNNIVNKWKEKNTKFYNNAITTWTIRDINKINIVKENNLNYLVFYDINKFIQWIYE